MNQLTIVVAPDESGGFVVAVPALPGCVTHGDTLGTAIDNARLAITLYLNGETAASLTAAGVRSEIIATILDAVPAESDQRSINPAPHGRAPTGQPPYSRKRLDRRHWCQRSPGFASVAFSRFARSSRAAA
ncbi:MAG: type II toxin-antitoxin system HicB family antitoxin [Chloroflexota bacterium]|nr:type II toxin-antitoxin system HicB family antitoxin [Chloroflexota bacterium]